MYALITSSSGLSLVKDMVPGLGLALVFGNRGYGFGLGKVLGQSWVAVKNESAIRS